MMISSGLGMSFLLHPAPFVARRTAIVHQKPLLQIPPVPGHAYLRVRSLLPAATIHSFELAFCKRRAEISALSAADDAPLMAWANHGGRASSHASTAPVSGRERVTLGDLRRWRSSSLRLRSPNDPTCLTFELPSEIPTSPATARHLL